jgi:V8-like Glu-specific endopeptidase
MNRAILDAQQLQRIAETIARLPAVLEPVAFRAYLEMLLYGVPEIDKILRQVTFYGAAEVVSQSVVMRFLNAGRYAPGRSYLHDLVSLLSEAAPADYETKEFLRDVAGRLAQGFSPEHDRPASVPAIAPTVSDSDWRGRDSPSDIQSFKERVIGENTLRPFFYLRLGWEAGQAVCRISAPDGTGTGFLVARDRILTNNHVVDAAADLEQTDICFRFEKNPNGSDAAAIRITADPKGLFVTSSQDALDATLFGITMESAARLESEGIRPLALSRHRVADGDRVAIIQHPGGLEKQVSFQNNKVQYADDEIVDYTTTTLPGSSGSPVFNDHFQVVALHREGGNLQQPGTNMYYYRNRGTGMIALLGWLEVSGVTGLTIR